VSLQRWTTVTVELSSKEGRIMYCAKRFGGLAVLSLMLGSLVLCGSALAQSQKSVELHLEPISDSGVSGTATLSDVKDGVQVNLSVQGLPEAGVEHINHFHGGGTCADVQAGSMAPVTIPLKTIVAKEDGTGSATTTIKDVNLDELLGKDQHRFILVHAKVKEGQGVPPGISCADLPQSSANTTFKSLPSSGGLPPVVLLVIPLVMLLLGISAALMLLRRIA
jgi:Cu/Zn superoxide dismutase